MVRWRGEREAATEGGEREDWGGKGDLPLSEFWVERIQKKKRGKKKMKWDEMKWIK